MTNQELNQILNSLSLIKIEEMEVQDQIKFLAATYQFAEQVKPLIVKYSNKLPQGGNFLFKL